MQFLQLGGDGGDCCSDCVCLCVYVCVCGVGGRMEYPN